jgi:hypothetical protein
MFAVFTSGWRERIMSACSSVPEPCQPWRVSTRDFLGGIDRIVQIFKSANHTRLNVLGGPALIPVLAGENKLRIGQAEGAQ